MNLQDLHEPFPPYDIEWRIGQAGQKGEKIWAKCLAYITSRAIMDRLDEVCGPGNWQTAFRDGGGHLQAGIGIRVGDEWVWKWDGTGMLASNDGLSGADAGKGDFSNALKRAAVQWGIGRYLYRLPEGWATVNDAGRFYQPKSKNKGTPAFHWDPPALPSWATPSAHPAAIALAREVAELLERHKDIPESAKRAAQEAVEARDVGRLNAAVEWFNQNVEVAA